MINQALLCREICLVVHNNLQRRLFACSSTQMNIWYVFLSHTLALVRHVIAACVFVIPNLSSAWPKPPIAERPIWSSNTETLRVAREWGHEGWSSSAWSNSVFHGIARNANKESSFTRFDCPSPGNRTVVCAWRVDRHQ